LIRSLSGACSIGGESPGRKERRLEKEGWSWLLLLLLFFFVLLLVFFRCCVCLVQSFVSPIPFRVWIGVLSLVVPRYELLPLRIQG
jgi:hypothetical protein